ncbi:OmpH family outer membrane protein [Pajaroellobacter abortibovis]|nr:OmpH family outer membrane protein [Pajaroellobacter abortibovis]
MKRIFYSYLPSPPVFFLPLILLAGKVGQAKGAPESKSGMTPEVKVAPDVKGDGKSRIAVIDMERAIAQTEEGLRAQAKLKSEFDTRQRELNEKQQKLAKEKENLDKQMSNPPRNDESRKKLQAQLEIWQRDSADLQAKFMAYSSQLDADRAKAINPIYNEIKDVLAQIASRDGYDLVVEERSAYYYKRYMNITDQVVQNYNQRKKVTPSTPPSPSHVNPSPSFRPK